MADENIEIRIEDKVSPGISEKLKSIASNAKEANNEIRNLKVQLGLQKLQTELAKTAIQQQKLTAEVNKTNVSFLNSENALNRAIISENKAATSAQQLAIAQQRLQTEQQRTNTAYLQSEAALNRAVASETQAATATQNLSIAQQRLQTASVGTQTAQQRLAAQTSQASAASSRAVLAALRLQNAQQRLQTSSTGAGTSLLRYARYAALAAGVTISARELLQAADAYTVLQNKLQRVADSQQQVNRLTDELFDISNRTFTGIDATTTSFARFDRALKVLGKSQQDSLDLTETVNKALVISGLTANEASSALLQLSQAFNSGRLQGDEFRSVSENMPIVLDGIAKALGVPIQQVKELSRQGKVTSEVLFQAFNSIKDQVDTVFGNTSVTVERAFTVLKNSAIQFFGELNKATGFTASLSSAILALSKNLDVLAFSVTVAGTALLVAFGPTLLRYLDLARAKVIQLTIAIAENPIGLILVGISAVIAGLVFFGDKIKVTSDGLVNLQDVARVVFDDIKEIVVSTASFFFEVWKYNMHLTTGGIISLGLTFKDVGIFILTTLKTAANGVIGIFFGLYDLVTGLWSNFPKLMKGFFNSVVNDAQYAIELLVEGFVSGLRKISNAVASVAPNFAKGLNESLNSINVKFTRLDVSEIQDAKKIVNDILDSLKNDLETDYLGDYFDGILAKARKIAEARNAANAGELRGAGIGPASEVEDLTKRAAALAKVNLELDNEAKRLFTLSPQREAQARFDQIEEKLIGKKIILNADEAASIRAKIDVLQKAADVQKAFDSIYEEAIGPARDYNATLQAADLLLTQGAISQERYARSILKASEAYANSLDPLRQYNRDLQQQNDLLSVTPKYREREAELQRLQNSLLSEGITLRSGEVDKIREQLTTLQEKNLIAQQEAQIFQETQGGLDQLTAKQSALNVAFQQGAITQQYYQNQLLRTNIAIADLKNQTGNGDISTVLFGSIDGILQDFTTLAAGISDSISQMFQSLTDGVSHAFAAAIVKGDDLKKTLQNLSQTVLTELLASLIKLGIQALINAAIGKTALAASTIASISAGAAVAAAWAPAAAAVSLASYGANAIPANAALTSTFATSKILSVLTGFAEGGYTGNIGRNEVAGVVHGKEFVINASATNRIGVNDLQDLQRGTASVVSNTSRTTGSVGRMSGDVIVNIYDQTTGEKVQSTVTQTETDNGKQIDIVLQTFERKLASNIRDGRGEVPKAFESAFGVKRGRS